MGLPCVHKLIPLLENCDLISLESIHPQWCLQEIVVELLDKPDAKKEVDTMLLLLLQEKVVQSDPHVRNQIMKQLADILNKKQSAIKNPVVAPTRGCPTGSTNKRSTTCDPLESEAVCCPEIVKKCGHCKEVGHNHQICPNLKISG